MFYYLLRKIQNNNNKKNNSTYIIHSSYLLDGYKNRKYVKFFIFLCDTVKIPIMYIEISNMFLSV